jgi:hypothetical protein
LEVQLQHDGWRASAVAAVKQLRSIHKVLRDAAPFYEPSLVTANKVGDGRLELGGQDFGDGFD